VIEGACRHLIADRLGITDARWGLAGAGAFLKLHALISNGDLDGCWRFPLAHERQCIHEGSNQDGCQLAA
jgi:hypothetical protein